MKNRFVRILLPVAMVLLASCSDDPGSASLGTNAAGTTSTTTSSTTLPSGSSTSVGSSGSTRPGATGGTVTSGSSTTLPGSNSTKAGVNPGVTSSTRAGTGTSTTLPKAAACVSATSFSIGGTNKPAEVAMLQQALRRFGFEPGKADGVFGKATLDAAAREAKRNGVGGVGQVSVTKGTVGADTFERLGIACGYKLVVAPARCTQRNEFRKDVLVAREEVAMLQIALHRKGLNPGAADGIYGAKTLAALSQLTKQDAAFGKQYNPTLGRISKAGLVLLAVHC